MKKTINILLLLFIIISSYLLNNSILLPITLSFGLIYYSLLSSFSISNILGKYNNKLKVFVTSIIIVLIISIIFIILSFIIGGIINIKYLNIINIFVILSITSNILIKILSQYLKEIKYKKLSSKIIYIYYKNSISLSIVYIIISRIFGLKEYLNIIVLSSIFIIMFIGLMSLLYLLVFCKEKGKKERINYISMIKNIIITNKNRTFYNIINSSYIYTSIIILYYSLVYKYNYNSIEVSKIITNYFVYGSIFIYILNNIINKYLINKEKDNINKTLNSSLKFGILIMVISGPICNLLFNRTNFLLELMPLFIIYSLYDYIVSNCLDNKKIRMILIISLIVKVIFELPLINTVYRMGYDLVLGSILSIIIGLIISIVLSIILFRNKLKVSVLDNFNKLLGIVYENIIYSLVLVVLTLLVKVNVVGKLNNFLVIIFYIIVTLIFYMVKKIIKKK